jgi:hypothetical protein
LENLNVCGKPQSTQNKGKILTDIIEKYVRNMKERTRREVITDYELYRVKGITGETTLRIEAQSCATSCGVVGDTMITKWMDIVAMECYRYYCLKHIYGKWD